MSFADIVGIIGLLMFMGILFKLAVVMKASIKRIPDSK